VKLEAAARLRFDVHKEGEIRAEETS